MISECKHCDHCVGGTDRVKIHRCCHCGRERTERIEPINSTACTYNYDKSKHGPHIQQSDIVRFGP